MFDSTLREEQFLVRGMEYMSDEEGGLVRGMRYIPEHESALTRGMVYLTKDVRTEEDNEKKREEKGQDSVKVISKSAEANEIAKKIEYEDKKTGFPRGMCVVDPSFIMRPNRKEQNVQRYFSRGNFGLVLLQIENDVYDTPVGEEEKRYYNFQIVTQGQIFQARVQFSDVEDPKWIKKFSQGEAFVFPEKNTRRDFFYYIHDIIRQSSVPEIWTYESTGWRKLRDGRYYYIDSNGAVGHQEFPVRCREDLCILQPEWMGKKEDYVMEAVNMIGICNNKKVSTLLFLFHHIGLLTTLFESANFPVRFVVGCIGVSNSRKTSLATLMSQLFNRSTIKPEVTYSSTEGGLEMAISKYGDAILLIDDLMPGANKQKQNILQSKLEMVLRAYGDRVAKRRMTMFCKTAEKAYFPVKGCCLMTGEQIAGAYSSMSRIVVLSQTRQSVDLEKLTYHQARPHILALYSYDFLCFVTENYEKIISFIEEKGVVLRNKQAFKVPRFSEAYAVFIVAAEIVCRYLQQTKRFSEIEIRSLQKLFEETVVSVLCENERRLLEQDMTVIILSALREKMVVGTGGFVEKTAYTGNPEAILYDDKYIYVKLETLYLSVKEYINKYDIMVVLNDKRQIVTYLTEAEMMETRTTVNGRTENARKIIGLPSNHARYLYLYRKKIEEKLCEEGIL